MKKQEALGIDIGGSGIKGAMVDLAAGHLQTQRLRIPTPKPATPEAIVETIKEVVGYFDSEGDIGCGFPAVVQQGVVTTASNIDESWIGVNINSLFKEATGRNIIVINDADAAGLAEMQYGAGRGREGAVVLITVGTGLGTAIFNKGHLLPNTELGHILLKNGKAAEDFASDSARKKLGLNWQQWGKSFNEYLLLLEFYLHPDLFIIGGGVSKRFERFEDLLEIETEIVPAQLLNHAGIIGAALEAVLHE